ncbi:aspartyl protease family protein [Klebsiella sp. MISC125]|uniref:aspartyl protease family protein n=1 Tax=Klebsiella sp. MISC125 TaxID=2755386 RepID=UPI003DA9CB03
MLVKYAGLAICILTITFASVSARALTNQAVSVSETGKYEILHRGDYLLLMAEKKQRLAEEPHNNALRWELSQDELMSGNLEDAEKSLEPLLAVAAWQGNATYSMGLIHYSRGQYSEAEKNFSAIKMDSPFYQKSRSELLYVYYQTGQYAKALQIFNHDTELSHLSDNEKALVQLMRDFGDIKPYQLLWRENKAKLPFISMNNLPVVSVKVNGQPINVFIDTGADLFVLNSTLAEKLGIKPIASYAGIYAGGKTAETRYSRLERLDLGAVTLSNVPVDLAEFPPEWIFTDEKTGETIEVDGILSTGVFHQFLTTLDYPQRQLVLKPRSGTTAHVSPDATAAARIPFILDGSHFMIVKGAINGKEGMTFFLDSGLDDPEASILLQQGALDYVGIKRDPQDAFVPDNSKGGLGGGGFEITRLSIDSVALGPLKQTGLTGLFGVLPDALYHTESGMILDGFISHQFLRHYKWTIDFDSMAMTFE